MRIGHVLFCETNLKYFYIHRDSTYDALIDAKKDAEDWRPWRKMRTLTGNCERRPITSPNLKKVNPQKAMKFRTKRRYGKPTQKNIIVVQHRSC